MGLYDRSESRVELEALLIEAVNQLEVDVNSTDWVASSEFRRFIECWNDLKRYYEKGSDTVIGAEVVAELIAIMRLLRRLIDNQAIQSHQREQVSGILQMLEVVSEAALREAAANAHYLDE